MVISIGRKYRVNHDGQKDVLVKDAAHDTSNGVTGFLCELLDSEGTRNYRVIYPDDFITEIL